MTAIGRWRLRATCCSTSGRRRWTSVGSWRHWSWGGWREQPRSSTKSTGSSISTSAISSDSSTGQRTRRAQAAADAVTIGDEDPSFAGGTYVIVQKYLHDMAAWEALSVEEQERVIGRAKLSNVEMDDEVKPSNSHVALNTIVEEDGTQRQILRENMPFGSLGAGEFGTYFIGYAATPAVTELMLQHMFLGDPPGNSRPDPRFFDGSDGIPLLRADSGLSRRSSAVAGRGRRRGRWSGRRGNPRSGCFERWVARDRRARGSSGLVTPDVMAGGRGTGLGAPNHVVRAEASPGSLRLHHPCHVAVGSDQHRGRSRDLAQHREFPRAMVHGVDQLDPVGPWRRVETPGPAEVEEYRTRGVQQAETRTGPSAVSRSTSGMRRPSNGCPSPRS